LFVIIVFAIIFPFLSIILDLNSVSIKALFEMFFFNEPRKIALVEKINDTITKTKKIKATLLKDIFRLFFFVSYEKWLSYSSTSKSVFFLFRMKNGYHILQLVNLYFF